MKNPLAAIKSVNFKEFAVQHGEKVALSLVGLVILLTLFFGTQWSRYGDTKPDDLKENVAAAAQRIGSAQWPQEEAESLQASIQGPASPRARVEGMLRELPLNDPEFAFNMGGWMWPVKPDTYRSTEPNWLRMTDPVAEHGRLTIDVPLQTAALDGGDPMKETLGDGLDDLVDDDTTVLQPRSPFDARRGGVGGSSEAGEGLLAGRLEGFAPGGAGMEIGLEGSSGEGSGELSQPSGYPTHYVAVRMLFPARDQLRAILNARGQVVSLANSELLSIQDFEIQRSQAIAGPGDEPEWSEWQEFKLDKTLQLLDLVTDYDSEIVSPQVIDPTITMPLPMPKYGYWGPEASQSMHPKLEKYKLNAQQRAQLDVVTSAFENARQRFSDSGGGLGSFPGFGEEEGIEGAGTTERQKGGWVGKVRDFKDVLSEVSQNREAQRAAVDEIKSRMSGVAGLEALNVQQLSLMGEYLLFRFVDFSVEPGRAYRYRAKLKFVNPNYGRPLDRVAHPSVAEGEFRPAEDDEKAWSDPTNAVVVPSDLEFYVEAIDRGTRYKEPRAKMRVHVWSENLGTWVAGDVYVSAGERVGGTEPVTTDVADLVNDKFEEKKRIRFEADDVLADLVTTPVLDPDDDLHAKYLGNLGVPRIDVVAPTMVLNEYGELVPHDPAAESDELAAADKRYELQMSALKPLLSEPVDSTSLDGEPSLDGGDYSDIYGAGGEGSEGAPRQRTSRRQRRAKGNPLRIGGGSKLELAPSTGTTGSSFNE